ncbi:MAG: hypothetical protein HY720_11270 [Planctomycetes bacterium]|nr:hypothetical protein [Planctomycetota bacterium]
MPEERCPACAESIPPGLRLCPQCGHDLLQAAIAPPVPAPAVPAAAAATLKKFHQQMNALGGVNILAAVLIAAPGAFLARDLPAEARVVFWGIVGGFAGAMTLLAVFLFLKHEWAVVVSLIFYFFFLVPSLFRVQICAIILMVACIAQGFRVLQMARALRAQGIDPAL